MVAWHHQLNGHDFEQTLGDSEGQGSLVCSSPWGCKESETTQQLNNNRSPGKSSEAKNRWMGGWGMGRQEKK